MWGVVEDYWAMGQEEGAARAWRYELLDQTMTEANLLQDFLVVPWQGENKFTEQ